MEKTFKEVAHLYLGCEVVIVDGIRDNNTDTLTYMNILGDCGGNQYEWLISNCRPILYRLEDITDKDAIELVSLWSDIFLNVEKKDVRYQKLNFDFNYASSRRVRTEQVDFRKLNSDQFLFLLSKHYDLFNLIDNGHAIDAKTL